MSGRVLKFDDSVHREADEMLPWFVNGTLEGKDLATVERHLRECARCQREVDLLQQMQTVCAIDVPVPDATPSYRRLHERIVGRPWLASFRGRVRGLFQPWQSAPAWAKWMIAAEFAGIVMLGVRVTMPVSESVGFYQSLGVPSAHAVRGGAVAVVFVPETKEADLRRIVHAAGARVVDGPTESNAYILDIPAGHRDAVLAALRAETAVLLAQPLTAQPDR